MLNFRRKNHQSNLIHQRLTINSVAEVVTLAEAEVSVEAVVIAEAEVPVEAVVIVVEEIIVEEALPVEDMAAVAVDIAEAVDPIIVAVVTPVEAEVPTLMIAYQ